MSTRAVMVRQFLCNREQEGNVRSRSKRTMGTTGKLVAACVICVSVLVATNGWAFQREPVSLVSLIAEPERYDGKDVSVTGYVLLGFEKSHLFLSPYDAQEFNVDNAIGLDFRKTDKTLERQWFALFDHQTVDIEATFYYPKKNAGPGGYWSGYPNGWLVNISSMRLHDLHPLMPAGKPAPSPGK